MKDFFSAPFYLFLFISYLSTDFVYFFQKKQTKKEDSGRACLRGSLQVNSNDVSLSPTA